MRNPRITKYYHSDDFEIWIVDPEIVRSQFDIEFCLGGHHYRYQFIPEREIWVEAKSDKRDQDANCAHEILERFLMKVLRWNYEYSHKKALKFEKKIRNSSEENSIAIAREVCDKIAKKRLMSEHKEKAIKLIDFPNFRQLSDFDCGSNALSAILAFFDIDVPEGELIKKLNTSEETGTNVTDIVRVAEEEYNLKTYSKVHMSVEELKRLISKGHPVLVLIQAYPWPEEPNIDWENDWKDGHYVIAIGFTEDKFIFEDPSSVKRTYISFGEFEKRWHDFDYLENGNKRLYRHWGMIFIPKEDKREYNTANIEYLR